MRKVILPLIITALLPFQLSAQDTKLELAVGSMTATSEVVTCEMALGILSGKFNSNQMLTGMVTGMIMGGAATMTNLTPKNAMTTIYVAVSADCLTTPKRKFADALAENARQLNISGLEDGLNSKK